MAVAAPCSANVIAWSTHAHTTRGPRSLGVVRGLDQYVVLEAILIIIHLVTHQSMIQNLSSTEESAEAFDHVCQYKFVTSLRTELVRCRLFLLIRSSSISTKKGTTCSPKSFYRS